MLCETYAKIFYSQMCNTDSSYAIFMTPCRTNYRKVRAGTKQFEAHFEKRLEDLMGVYDINVQKKWLEEDFAYMMGQKI